jgi:hypothetical protein
MNESCLYPFTAPDKHAKIPSGAIGLKLHAIGAFVATVHHFLMVGRPIHLAQSAVDPQTVKPHFLLIMSAYYRGIWWRKKQTIKILDSQFIYCIHQGSDTGTNFTSPKSKKASISRKI